MKEILISGGIFIAIASVLAFIIGILMQFPKDKKTKKQGLRLMLYSVIAFIIGFGTCFANFEIGPIH